MKPRGIIFCTQQVESPKNVRKIGRNLEKSALHRPLIGPSSQVCDGGLLCAEGLGRAGEAGGVFGGQRRRLEYCDTVESVIVNIVNIVDIGPRSSTNPGEPL